jgi:hypothetical protein
MTKKAKPHARQQRNGDGKAKNEAATQPDGEGEDAAIKKHSLLMSASWQKQVESIFETGRRCAAAKEELMRFHGAWTRLFDADNLDRPPFGQRTADRLIDIARHRVLSNPTHVSALPASWGTLYRLTQLPEQAIKGLIADGTINPELERSQVDTIQEKLAELVVFQYGKLSESLGICAEFADYWPDAKQLLDVAEVIDPDEHGDGVTAGELARLISWLGELRHAYLDRAQCASKPIYDDTGRDDEQPEADPHA